MSTVSAYIIYEGRKLGVPRWVHATMIGNVLIDWVIGLIPLVGDLLDIGWKANLKNVALIKKHAKIL